MRFFITNMRRLNRIGADPVKLSERVADNVVPRGPQSKCVWNPIKLMGVFVVCLMGFSVLFSISAILKDSSRDSIWTGADARVLDVSPPHVIGLEDNLSKLVMEHDDKLLNGLLSAGFDDKSCLSRYQSALYRKALQHMPSSHLVSRLRKYEALHKRCAPYTESYNRSIGKLKSGQQVDPLDCNYLVWISFSGLGNRILTLASAFVYALLTNRVLLVDRGVDMDDLFCEPFPEVSWLLPLDFPLTNQFNNFNQESPECYGKMVKVSSNSSISEPSPLVYLHLVHDYNEQDKLFFCDQDQSFLQKVPWLIMKSDNYFIPSLFLIPSFEQELNFLFPEKATVFHFVGRYLFFPTNSIWGLITRYYEAYLAKADEIIGIQIRVFDTRPGPFQYVLDQILACCLNENLLPEINPDESIINPTGNQKKTKAVLMTSLTSGYFEKFRDMYWEHSTANGEVIGFFQPSHEGYQQTEKKMHNRKAWAEMYLLSLADKLVTSSWSTFGYVAQSLGGLKPWILYKPENETAPNPPCRRAMSMEPCFHAPPFYDCKRREGTDTGALVPHVRHCEDMSWGLKLVDHTYEM